MTITRERNARKQTGTVFCTLLDLLKPHSARPTHTR